MNFGHLISCFLFTSFWVVESAKIVTGSFEFLINPNRRTLHNGKRSCPPDYYLAKLNTEELWEAGIAFSLKVMGHGKVVWIKQGLNWSGSGTEEWMILTPTNPETCKFPPKNYKSFCVPINRGKLAVNHLRGRAVPSLCMKQI